MQGVFAKFLKFGAGKTDAIMLDNAEWLTKLNYIEMLRDVGRHFSVNRMLTMDSVKLRLEREQEMSFIEFNYMICQAYDFVELARRTGCNLQMGGSDQWGNIVIGVDLGRRMGTHQLYALTTPLLTTASGAKMGKTAPGRRVAQRGAVSAPTTSGSTGATPRTPTSAASSSCSRRCRWPRSPGSRRCRAPRSTRPRRCWRPRRPRCCTAATRPRRPRKTAQETFEKGALARGPADGRDRGGRAGGGPRRAQRVREGGPGQVQRRGAAPDRRRRPARQRRGRCATRRRSSTPSDVRDGVIKLSLGKKRHVLLKPV